MASVSMDSCDVPVTAGCPMRVGMWEEEEHCRFLRGVVEFGKEWKEVRGAIGSRREKQIQSHFQKYVRKVARMVKKIKRKGFSFHYQDPVLEEERALYRRLFTPQDLTASTPSQLRSMILSVCAPDPNPPKRQRNIIITSSPDPPIRLPHSRKTSTLSVPGQNKEESQGWQWSVGEMSGQTWSPSPTSFFIAFSEDRKEETENSSEESGCSGGLTGLNLQTLGGFTVADLFPSNPEWRKRV